MKKTDEFDHKKLKELLPDYYSDIEVLETIDSTNSYLKRNYTSLPNGYVVLANEQTAGRGRKDHQFESKPDVGLYLSILLKPDTLEYFISHLTLLSAVALHQSIQTCYHHIVEIKWLNDLYMNEKKIAGILVETIISSSGRIEAVIVGIGINLHQQSFSELIADSVTSLENQLDSFVSRNDFTLALLRNFANLLICDDPNEVLSYYRTYCNSLSKPIYLDNQYVGIAVDLDHSGGLIVKDRDKLKTITVGSIRYEKQ